VGQFWSNAAELNPEYPPELAGATYAAAGITEQSSTIMKSTFPAPSIGSQGDLILVLYCSRYENWAILRVSESGNF
jgi:hypothetical protein